MKTFNKLCLKLEIDSLYDISPYLITEEQNSFIKYLAEHYPQRYITIDENILCETTYFQQWDVNDSCVNAVENILNKILEKYKTTGDIFDLEINYPIKTLLSEINYTTLSNFKNFHKFLDLLKTHAIGSIKISIGKLDPEGNNSSFYESPTKFGYLSKNELCIDGYYQHIEDLTKYEPTWHHKIQKIMQELFQLKNFGTINISANYFKNNELLKTAIAHELSHFFKFLIRINSMNYKYGLNYSRANQKNNNDLESYFSKPNEWKELAATYIEELAIIFKNLNIEHTHENGIKFINAVFRFSKVPYEQCFNFDEYEEFILNIPQENFHLKNIQKFIKTTYENSIANDSVRNNWKVFKKWIFNEFKSRFTF